MTYLMARTGPPGRRGTRRDAAHRARAATHPAGRCAPPQAEFPWPPAALRPACGALHRGANRA